MIIPSFLNIHTYEHNVFGHGFLTLVQLTPSATLPDRPYKPRIQVPIQ